MQLFSEGYCHRCYPRRRNSRSCSLLRSAISIALRFIALHFYRQRSFSFLLSRFLHLALFRFASRILFSTVGAIFALSTLYLSHIFASFIRSISCVSFFARLIYPASSASPRPSSKIPILCFLLRYLRLRLSFFVLVTLGGCLLASSSCALSSTLLSLDPYPLLFLPFLLFALNALRFRVEHEEESGVGRRSVTVTIERRFYNEKPLPW